MIRAIRRWGLLAVLGGALLGCTPRPMVQQKAPPPDPLLVTRKPIEGTQHPDDAGLTARLQPPLPPALQGELASSPAPLGPAPVHPAGMLGLPTAP
jgi:hypothetical protein